MNLRFMPMAMIATSLCTSPVIANEASMKFYGKANFSLNKNDFEEVDSGAVQQEEDNWTLNSNASRLGVKGSLPINENLQAIYKMEYEVFIDGQGGSSSYDILKQRNIYGGLQGDFGTAIAGKHDTPLKLAQGKVDRFNDLDRGDIKYILVGENRDNNLVMYTSPKFAGGIAITTAIVLGEDSGTGSNDDDGLFDSLSIAATWRNDSFYVAAAIDENVHDTDVIRLVGEYSFNDFKIGALIQTAEQDESSDPIGSVRDPIGNITGDYSEQDAFLLSGQWKVENIVLKAQFVLSESKPIAAVSLDDTEATQIVFGADYKLSKGTKLYAYYAQVDAEGDSLLTNDDVTDSTLGAGIEIKF